MKIKSIKNFKKLKGKKILVRVDFNVPIRNGKVKDEYKIVRHLPTIRFLQRHNCKIILMSHLGRPISGVRDDNLSLLPVIKRLGEILDKDIKLIIGFDEFKDGSEIGRMEDGDIVMFENLRFNEGEKENSSIFAKKLTKFADIYVNDAFAVSHRAHASVAVIKNYLPSYAGLLLEKEIKNLAKVLKPKNPLVVIIGGVKLKTKLALIENFSKKADKMLIGGAMANNFFVAHGLEVGKSLTTKEGIEIVKRLKIKNVIIPIDVVVSTHRDGGNIVVKSINKVKKNDYIFDIGPETIKLYSNFIRKANTLVWNGPMGKFELKSFRAGTMSIAQLLATRSGGRAFGVVGGGETVESLKMSKMIDYVDWVSTGGGAMLSYLGGEKMPGLKGIVR
ncbi:phosphoglycerate kinase [Candidatus Parcubacteria bacterium]|nr:phosphoglycerate kinase [Candidatus Parcubacteria bacterium]